jgi:hypothetical protein
LVLARQAPVRVRILDVQGREVARPVERTFPAGSHTVAWDGSRLAAGVYFAACQADGRSELRRFAIVR